MNQSIAHKILDLQERFAQEPDFATLLDAYRKSNDLLLDAVDTMTQTQKEAVFQYIGYLSEIYLQLIEYGLSC